MNAVMTRLIVTIAHLYLKQIGFRAKTLFITNCTVSNTTLTARVVYYCPFHLESNWTSLDLQVSMLTVTTPSYELKQASPVSFF